MAMVVIEDLQEARKQIRKYNSFQECILEEIIFDNYFTKLTISIINLWTKDGQLRRDLDERKEIVHIEFIGVNVFNIFNDLNINILSHPEKKNWGYNEIALIEIQQTDDHYLRVLFLWESKRKIELTCRKFIILAKNSEINNL